MAIASTTVWEVRTSGDDTNGGGFNAAATGTDYSQQDAAQQTYTDLVIDASNNTEITSAAHPFDATHVGNIIRITATVGFTAGRYQIVSVTAVTHTAVLDRAVGTVAATAGQGSLGGALASPGLVTSAKTAQNQVWIKAGTYSMTNNATSAAAGLIDDGSGGTIAKPSVWRGYQTTRGDDGTKPVMQCSLSSTVGPLFNASAANVIAWNLEVRGPGAANGNGRGISLLGSDSIIYKCTAGGFTSTHLRVGTRGRCIYSLADGNGYGTGDNTGYGFYTTANGCTFFGCVARKLRQDHFYGGGTSGFFYCIAYGGLNSATAFVGDSDGCHWHFCTAYNMSGGGWSLPTNNSGLLDSCMVYTSNRSFAVTSSGSEILLRCAGGNATLANNLSKPVFNYNYITLTADPFTNAAGEDFTLNSAAGGGALLKSAGYPDVYLLNTGTHPYPNVGAYQNAAATGGDICADSHGAQILRGGF